jgi:uncharacterized membrane protein
MFKREDLIPIDMRPEEALKFIVSCGVIIPESQLSSQKSVQS